MSDDENRSGDSGEWYLKILAINKLNQRENLQAAKRAVEQLGGDKGLNQAGPQRNGKEEIQFRNILNQESIEFREQSQIIYSNLGI